ncbi:AMP-binding protein [Enemella sp. A6]|uniref:AMP-binding protein n=1 Tax=Enemella sp. A6 TaxID=3440152 RepID=UPI003EB7EE17
MTRQPPRTRPARGLRPIDTGDLAAVVTALKAALDGGGPAIAPLPTEPGERHRTLTMCAPGQPLESDVAAVVGTSGSTGSPKGVMLSAEAITAGAESTHRALSGPGAWHLALPAHYVAGLMVIARTVVAGTDLVPVAADLSDLSARTSGPNYLSLVPTQLRRARADAALVERLARFDAVLVGGAASTPEELAWWADNGVRIVTTYGMSETSGGCVYNGLPLSGVEVELAADDRVLITGEVVFSGYRLRPDLTAEVLQDAGGRRRFRTSDRGRWVDGRLQILGRVDDVIISGGINVDLAEVERVAQRVLADPSLVAVGLPDPEWGTIVALFGPELDDPATVREALADHLSRAALPRAIGRGEPPLTSGGKIDRREIVRRWTMQHRADVGGGEQL